MAALDGSALPGAAPALGAAPAATGSTLPGQTGAGALASLTPDQVSALASQVGASDPSLGAAAMRLLRTPLSAVGTALNVLGAPGRAIRSAVLGAPSGSEFLAKSGWATGGGAVNEATRGIASFLIDAVTDPLTYLTGGAEGLSTDAAKQLLLGTGLDTLDHAAPELGWAAAKAAGTPALEFALAQPEGTAARALAEGIHGTPSWARALQNAKDVVPGLKDNLPDKLTSGLALKIPLGPKVPLVPAEITGKITAPLGEAVKDSGLYNGLARNLSKFSGMLAGARSEENTALQKGAEGVLAKQTLQDAEHVRLNLERQGQDLSNQVYRAFGTDAKGKALASAVFQDKSPEAVAAALAAKGQTALTAAQSALVPKVSEALDQLYEHSAYAAGDKAIAKIPGYFPRHLTEEALKVGNGAQNPLGVFGESPVPKSMLHRSQELVGMDFPTAQKYLSEKLGVSKAFEEDPAKLLQRAFSNTAQGVSQRGLVQQLTARGLTLPTLDKTQLGLSKTELAAAGLKAKEAIALVRDGVQDPRLQLLSPEQRQALDSHVAVQQASSDMKIPKAAERVRKGEANVQKFTNSLLNIQAEFNSYAEPIKAHTLLSGSNSPAVNALKNRAKLELEHFKDSSALLDKAEERLGIAKMKLANLQAGLKSSGDEWPVTWSKEIPQGWRQINTGMAPGVFAGKVAPSWLADQIENTLSVTKGAGVPRAVDAFTNGFKHFVTNIAVNPAFALKRAEGMGFAHILAGGQARDLLEVLPLGQAIHSGGPSAEMLAEPIGRTGHTVQDLLQHFSQTGVGKQAVTESGELLNTDSALRRLADEGASRFRQPGFGSPAVAEAQRVIDSAGNRVLGQLDTTGRLATFLSGLEMSNWDPEFARMMTLQAHGDFSDLAPFEKQVLRRVLPFYTWLRVKTPLILRSITQDPGFVVNSQRAFADLFGDQAATANDYANGTFPEQQAQKGGVVSNGVLAPLFHLLGANGPVAISSDLPTFSLNELLSAGGLESALNPALGETISLLTHTAAYPGQVTPLKYMMPATGSNFLLAKALEHVPELNTLVGRTNTGSLRINSTLGNLVRQLPTSMFTGLEQTLPGVGNKPGGFAKYLLPVTATEMTPSTVGGQLAGEKSQLNALVSELYTRGLSKQYAAAKKQFPTSAPSARAKAPSIPGLKLPKAYKVSGTLGAPLGG